MPSTRRSPRTPYKSDQQASTEPASWVTGIQINIYIHLFIYSRIDTLFKFLAIYAFAVASLLDESLCVLGSINHPVTMQGVLKQIPPTSLCTT